MSSPSWKPLFSEAERADLPICRFCERPGVHANVDDCLTALYRVMAVTNPMFVRRFPHLFKLRSAADPRP